MRGLRTIREISLQYCFMLYLLPIKYVLFIVLNRIWSHTVKNTRPKEPKLIRIKDIILKKDVLFQKFLNVSLRLKAA